MTLLSVVTRHSETWFRVTWHPVLLKKDATPDSGVNNTGKAVFLDFKYAIDRLGRHVIEERYGNLFQMYEKITAVDPYNNPMMIYPAIHYSMGGLWVDYNLMTTIRDCTLSENVTSLTTVLTAWVPLL